MDILSTPLIRPDRSRLLSRVVLLLALVAGLLVAQTESATAADTASISGTVTKTGSTDVAGQDVEVERLSGGTWSLYGDAPATTTSSGAYTVSNLPPGTYRVRAGAANELEPGYAITYYGNVTDPAAATSITLAAGQARTGFDIVRGKIPSISGTVTGPGGSSLGSTWAVEARRKLPDGTWGPKVYAERYNGGVYKAFLPTAGQYALRFSATDRVNEYYDDVVDDGSAARIEQATLVTVGPSSSPTGINAELTGYSTISGTVTKQDVADHGAFGVEVLRASDRTTRVAYSYWRAGTAADDTWSLKVPPGQYVVRFEGPSDYADQFYDHASTRAAAQAVTVPPSSTVGNVDADLELRGTLSGTVTGAGGAALSGVRVYAYRDGVLDDRAPVVTDGDGKYAFKLDPGQWVLRFQPAGAANAGYAQEFWDDQATLSGATRISLANGQSKTADARLEARGSLHGVIRDADGVPVAGALVEVVDVSGTGASQSSSTDSAGRYELNALPHRAYKLLARAPGQADTYYGRTRSVSTATAVAVDPGAVKDDVSWQLLRQAGVSGRVTSPAGSGLGGVTVSARRFVDEGTSRFWYAEATTTTVADGTYTLRAKPGNYAIFFSGTGLETSHYPGVASPVLADQVTIPADGVVRPGYDAVLRSSSGVPAVANVTAPSFTGTLKVGETLTATAGTWDPADAALRLVWSVGGESTIVGEGPTLVVPPGAVGQKIGLHVVASKPGYLTTTASTVSTTLVGASTRPTVTNTRRPSVSGTAAVGQTLTAEPGSWSPAPTSIAYQWYRGGLAITDATSQTYEPQRLDTGAALSVLVTAGASGLAAGQESSLPTQKVTFDEDTDPEPPALSPAPPVVSGASTIGKSLKVTPPTFAVSAQPTYQWRRGGQPISGATGATYKLVKADAGQDVTAVVKASAPGYQAYERASDPVTARHLVTLKVTGKAKKPGKAQVVVTARSTTLSSVGGAVTVTRGSTAVTTATVKKGTATITLAGQPKGRQTYTLTFTQTGNLTSAVATVTIKIG